MLLETSAEYPPAVLGWLALAVVLVMVVLSLGGSLLWAFTGVRAKRGESVGGAPMWMVEPLKQGEAVVAQSLSTCREYPGRSSRASSGMLFITSTRLIYTPRRSFMEARLFGSKPLSLELVEIDHWTIEERHTMGYVNSLRHPYALVVSSSDKEVAFWCDPESNNSKIAAYLPGDKHTESSILA